MQYADASTKRDNLPVVEFYHDTFEDKSASAKEGRPIFQDREMVRIKFPADRQRTLVRPALSVWKKFKGEPVTYAQRFQDQYKRFKASDAQVVQGTPLAEAPFLTQAQRMSLKALDIYTIEQLASLSGQAVKNLGAGGLTQVEQAKAYLQSAHDSASVTKLAAELAVAKQMIAQLQTAPQPKVDGPYAHMSDEDLKTLIAEKTGAKPRGNPSRVTLERMAAEVADKRAA